MNTLDEMKDSKLSQLISPKRLHGVSGVIEVSAPGHVDIGFPSISSCEDMKECAQPMIVSPKVISTVGNLQIRRFELSDEAGVDVVGEACYPPNLEDAAAFQAKLYIGDSFVAIDSLTGQVVAYAVGVPWHNQPMHINAAPTSEDLQGADVYVIHDVAVHPMFRKGGVASVLLSQLFECARERNLNKLVLVAINPVARTVWSKKGFMPMVCNVDSGYGAQATKMEMYL